MHARERYFCQPTTTSYSLLTTFFIDDRSPLKVETTIYLFHLLLLLFFFKLLFSFHSLGNAVPSHKQHLVLSLIEILITFGNLQNQVVLFIIILNLLIKI